MVLCCSYGVDLFGLVPFFQLSTFHIISQEVTEMLCCYLNLKMTRIMSIFLISLLNVHEQTITDFVYKDIYQYLINAYPVFCVQQHTGIFFY